MRKLLVGLVVAASLAVVPAAMAQVPGSQDPLSLITSGAVLPFIGQGLAEGGGMSFLELYAPVSDVSVHMFLFDANCVRQGPSLNEDLTANDVALRRVDNIGGGPTSGLVTAGGPSSNGFSLTPLAAPIHARTLWANTNSGFVRVFDPIALSTLDNDISGGAGFWNPLRTGAAFYAPLETGDTNTTIYFVCPNTNIQRAGSTSTSGAFPVPSGFPDMFPDFQAAGINTPLLVRVYDDEENFLRDVTSSCNCLTTRPVTALDPVYASAAEAPFGTYTEVEGGTTPGSPAQCSATGQIEPLVNPPAPNSGNTCPRVPLGCETGVGPACTGQIVQTAPAVPAGGPFAFVAYRSIVSGPFDVFNRVSNGWRCAIQGNFGCETATAFSFFR